MNQDASCHLLANSVYIDGFSAYSNQWKNSLCSWVLSHYHADHYKGLKRGTLGRNQLNGTIHCTEVTKLLLERVHFVDDEGNTKANNIKANNTKANNTKAKTKAETTPLQQTTKIQSHSYGEEFEVKDGKGGVLSCTFLPANHCPGAAILLFSTSSDPKTINIHCGDMRYSPSMLEAVLERREKGAKFGEIFLDTTYGFPKSVIDSVALSVVSELSHPSRTLILLSCYSIGKEKLLAECAMQTAKKLYVNPKKALMLQCVKDGSLDDGSGVPPSAALNLITSTTSDPASSPIHVIPMNVAGEMFPYFIPDYRNCADYADKHGGGIRYDRVVAFIPTGWANATNWNRKNATNMKQVPRRMKKGDKGVMKTAEDENDLVEVTVNLVGYSEHSTYKELVAFVEGLKPVKVTPTVYSSEEKRKKITDDFNKYCDRGAAKEKFLSSFFGEGGSGGSKSSKKHQATAVSKLSMSSPPKPSFALPPVPSEGDVALITSMGFSASVAEAALAFSKNNAQRAVEYLLSSSSPPHQTPQKRQASDKNSPKPPPKREKTKTLDSFFLRPKK